MPSSRSLLVTGALPVAAMAVVVVSSNYLVQFAINDWLTWGAFTYPAAFLVTDLTNRLVGPGRARLVAGVGFALAVILSLWLADPRIALASGAAFLTSQLSDIHVFNRLRGRVWWMPPLVSSFIASVLDTTVFFSLAFAGTGLPWFTWGLGDLAVKLAFALGLVAPFRAVLLLVENRRAAGLTAQPH
ncbi:queuosine precursor transporter [Pararhodospirillum oryzae]|uniref:Probable queuosine precursor transporter n=1 Tax=Pararhodospirillum oryzae TaxID=478448 RepID=A0A512H7S6_9PROT|nr:queuosine precursor transporter [Pararhodospirillum oryzae]GEO81478.1 membrane protein [Pararhodospirillum oryzae]